jgi:two-component system, cell cycle sensor histidine kinase and response regulator CckA
MPEPIRLLVIEDSEDDAALLARELGREGFAPLCTRVEIASALKSALKNYEFDVIISDFSLPAFTALEALEIVKSGGFDLPFIVVSGSAPETAIVDALRHGARDYVMKENLTRLPLVIRRELDESIERRRRRGFDEQLRHTQRLESVGLLAGGIAHDFNNLLTGVLGNTTLVLGSTPESSPHRAPLERVVKAAEQAAHLTRQLLAYAGKGQFLMELLSVNELIRNLLSLLHVSTSRHVDLRVSLHDRLPLIRADRGQMQQLIMNLVINAAEAIPADAPGNVTVATGIETLSADDLAQASVRDSAAPGPYVCLEVRDTGAGIDRETQARIFDPFFTTKFTGRGLGLAAVMGIVRGHGGALRVVSAPGSGSTFTVHFPVATDQKVAELPMRSTEKPRVLVIDDERTVRQTCHAMLERCGYDVLLAENGKEGVETFTIFADQIAMVLLDLSSPGRNGERTLEKIRQISPDLPIVLMTGENERQAMECLAGRSATAFVTKPFRSAELQRAIERAMQAQSAGSATGTSGIQ